MKQKEEGLKREVGVFGLSTNIVNIVVGAGIFVIPAIVTQKMGSTSIVAYLVCGVLIALIMLCFAEIGSKVTNTGGSFAYIEEAFGEYPGFIAAIVSVAAGVMADAAIANALIDILAASFEFFNLETVRISFFLVVFFGLGAINIIGVKQGIRLVKVITLLKLTPLFILIIFGFKDINISNLYWESTPTIKQIGETCLILIFAFQGAESGLVIGGEIKNPKKTVPKAIFLSILSILIIYILIQTVTQGVMGIELANFKEAPLAATAEVIFGPIGYTLLFIGAAVSMFGFLTGEILNNPRVLFASARDKVLPIKPLERIHSKFKTPYIAILTYVSIGFLIATFSGFGQLIEIASATILLIYLGVVFSVIKLRLKRKPEKGEFKIPGGFTVPILSAITILYIMSNLEMNKKIGMILFIGVISMIYIGIQYFKRKNND